MRTFATKRPTCDPKFLVGGVVVSVGTTSIVSSYSESPGLNTMGVSGQVRYDIASPYCGSEHCDTHSHGVDWDVRAKSSHILTYHPSQWDDGYLLPGENYLVDLRHKQIQT